MPSSNSSPPPAPELDIEALFDDIFNSNITSQLLSSFTSSSNIEQRTKVYKWKCIANPTYNIISSETGVHKKVTNPNPSLQWEWESLSHNGLAMDGFVVGGNLTYSALSATATISTYNSIMEIQVQLTATISIQDVTFTRSRALPPATRVFNVND